MSSSWLKRTKFDQYKDKQKLCDRRDIYRDKLIEEGINVY